MNFFEFERDTNYPDVWYNDKVKHFTSVVCPKYPGHQRGVRKDMPLSIEIKKPKIGDFISTVYSDWLVKDNVAELFSKYGFTGYRLRRVDIYNTKLPYDLWEIIVTGKGGEAQRKCGVYKKYECKYCHNTIYHAFSNETGIIVDEANWDGSDLFTINAYPKFILVSERVKMVIEENQLKGVILVRSTDLRRNEYYGNEVSPH
jgi:hypothetical protein